uniref:Uncharacterized protein n=2 Tax=Aegilops tauschii subsp. strangulata TaxID=200361 RepID=A0A453TD20_AEGTS
MSSLASCFGLAWAIYTWSWMADVQDCADVVRYVCISMNVSRIWCQQVEFEQH